MTPKSPSTSRSRSKSRTRSKSRRASRVPRASKRSSKRRARRRAAKVPKAPRRSSSRSVSRSKSKKKARKPRTPKKKPKSRSRSKSSKKRRASRRSASKPKKPKRKKLVYGSMRRVWSGTADRTKGNLKKADLCLNKRGKVVSKKRLKASTSNFRGSSLARWSKAMMRARGELGLTGFVACKKGTAYYKLCKKYYE